MPPTNIAVDLYNDCCHPEGELYPLLKTSIDQSNTVEHLHTVLTAARSVSIPVIYANHHQVVEGDFLGWKREMNVSHQRIAKNKVFEEGSFGVKIYKGLEPVTSNGDICASRHWNSSAFHNTDVDYILRQRGIENVILVGFVANTCLEATARYAYELGYNITMISDATAGFSTEQKDAATNLIWPLFANRVLTTDEWVATLKSKKE
ncbi:hypothetical protein MNV49_003490 [Pseudohyphozyma bogoriensis]|nr:hypothetical protein MNV49_003490 [Pseudohyphozyma bogoriensis]